ncbi:ketopantoate reductase family protein [Rhodoferax ferrireducens]|uniref:ketopantoate reductase family protein n=1 Tax=Rhodoferax ferrireducens TaxID=192843 RepID=UPI000E0CEA9B
MCSRSGAGCIVSVVARGATLAAPGLIQHHFGNGLIIGEPAGTQTGRLAQLAALLVRAGFDATVFEQIQKDTWYKLW